MQKQLQTLVNFFNYLFPTPCYVGKKITDIRWIRCFTPFAPYTAILICASLLVWGCAASPNHELMLSKQGAAAIVAAMWAFLFLCISSSLKKKGRSHAFPSLLANLLPLNVLLGLFLLLGFTSRLHTQFEQEYAQAKQAVANRIQERRESLREARVALEEQVHGQQKAIHASLQKLKASIGDVDELAKAFREKMEADRIERAEKSKQFWAKVNADIAARALERRERLKAQRLAWLKERHMDYFNEEENGYFGDRLKPWPFPK